MTRIMGLWCGIAVAVALAIMPASGAPLSDALASRIDEKIEAYLAGSVYGGVAPAMSVGVLVGGETVIAKGYGEADTGRPADADTLYKAGSLTKQFTAAAILSLIDQGAKVRRTQEPLALDTELPDIFDGLDHWSADPAHPVTVRRLLNMNSNLPNFTRRPPESADPWGAIPAQRLLAEIKQLGPTGWPDSFEYSNTSYFLLAEVMEAVDVAGRAGPWDYRSLLKRTLFDEAGLHATGFAGEETGARPLARPIHRRRPAFMERDWLKGSGDMVSNVSDLLRWNQSLMAGGILTPAAREAMFADGGRIGPTDWYGMGWFIAHEPGCDVYSHSGTVPGYTSFNGIFKPHDGGAWVSVTILSNIDNSADIDRLARDVADLFLLE